METELVAIPEGFITGSTTYVSAITLRYNNLVNALKTGNTAIITGARGNLQTFALNPTSSFLGYDPTPPEGWEFHVQATKTGGQIVTDSGDIFPGIEKQGDGSLMLRYPVL